MLLLLPLPVVRSSVHDRYIGRLSRSLHWRRTAVIGAMLHLILCGEEMRRLWSARAARTLAVRQQPELTARRRAILLRWLILLHLWGTTPASLFASLAIAVAAVLA